VTDVNRKLAVGLGLTGVAILLGGMLRRRSQRPALEADSRAENLRRRLAESRAAAREPAPAPAAAKAPEEAGESIAEARRRVYEEGQAAVEEMRRAGTEPAA
jgi:hypothetical protein